MVIKIWWNHISIVSKTQQILGQSSNGTILNAYIDTVQHTYLNNTLQNLLGHPVKTNQITCSLEMFTAQYLLTQNIGSQICLENNCFVPCLLLCNPFLSMPHWETTIVSLIHDFPFPMWITVDQGMPRAFDKIDLAFTDQKDWLTQGNIRLYKDFLFFLSLQSDEHMCNTRRDKALARLIRST